MAFHKILSLGALLAVLVTMAATHTPEERQNLYRIANASNFLGLNIYKELTKGSSGNVFFSPLSLSTALGLLYEGARGQSQKELRNVLGYEKAGLSDQDVPSTFQNLLGSLSNSDGKLYTLSNANALYIQKDLKVLEEYKNKAKDYFKALVKNVDFDKKNRQVISEINEFVSKNTNNKIPNFISDLDKQTVMFILNAVYFLGNWNNQFNPNKTNQQTFYNSGLDSQQKKVSMMHITEEFRYTTFGDSQVLEMPYKGRNISMVVILPNKRDGLKDIESQLDSDSFSKILDQLSTIRADVSFPKFKLDFSKDMTNAVQSLGAASIFGNGADLRGIAAGNDLKVSEIVHKAVIDVNEKGSEAAAATGIRITHKSLRRFPFKPDFDADHPFLFAIVDNRNGMILFMGQLSKL